MRARFQESIRLIASRSEDTVVASLGCNVGRRDYSRSGVMLMASTDVLFWAFGTERRASSLLWHLSFDKTGMCKHWLFVIQ